jgi:hypothetical protein
VVVWDLASEDELARFPSSEHGVSCLRWSASGETLAISFGDFSNREENSLLLWMPFDYSVTAQSPLEKPMAALAWLPGDSGLLSTDWQGNATIWQRDLQRPLAAGSLGPKGKEMAEAASWSADCSLTFASADGPAASGAE